MGRKKRKKKGVEEKKIEGGRRQEMGGDGKRKEENERVENEEEEKGSARLGESDRERDRRSSLFDASAQRVVEITQAGEITFSFCPRLGQRHEKKKGDRRSEKEYLVEKMDME